MVLLIALGSAFGGFMVSFVIFGGQLTNRYCSISTLDFICRWAIVLFYLLLSLLLIGYYIPGFIEESLRVLIYICFVAGILFGVQVVKKEIKKENPSVIISSIKMRKITLAAFVLLPVAAIMLNHDLISFILGFLWIALMLPASMLYLIDWYRTKGQPGRS